MLVFCQFLICLDFHSDVCVLAVDHRLVRPNGGDSHRFFLIKCSAVPECTVNNGVDSCCFGIFALSVMGTVAVIMCRGSGDAGLVAIVMVVLAGIALLIRDFCWA